MEGDIEYRLGEVNERLSMTTQRILHIENTLTVLYLEVQKIKEEMEAVKARNLNPIT